MVTLGEYLEADLTDADVERVEDEVGERFKLRSERAALWAMRKLADREEEMAGHIATANAERARIDAWVSEVNEKLANDCSFFTGLLVEWHAGQIEHELGQNPLHGPMDPDAWKAFKRKTRKLPAGDVSAKIGTGRFTSFAPEAAIATLETIGRDDLLIREPKIGATKLDEAAADPERGVMLDRDGNYLCLVAVDEVSDEAAARRIVQAHESDAPALAMIDTFADLLPAAAELDLEGRNVRLATTWFESHLLVDTWLVIPGVRKEGVGVVSITVKPKVGE